jgi:energy-converting hydrogenase Eha subunit A
MNEHEFEPVLGLPEPLPEGETILWQGAPRWQSITRRAFHADQLAVYFALMLALRASAAIFDGSSAADAALATAWLLPLPVAALGIFALMGRLVGQTTMYTITNRRVVMRIGIVLTVTFNIPFRTLESAGLKTYSDGTGDIALLLAKSERIAYLHLWPHARPWHLRHPQPMLRSLDNATEVAALLSSAIAATEGSAVRQGTQANDTEDIPARESSSLIAAQ